MKPNLELKYQIIKKFGSQADFAMALKCDESVISRILRGRRPMDPLTARLWSETLNIDVTQFFSGENQ